MHHDLLVASLFIRLPRTHVKHAYAFGYKGFQGATDVPAHYELFGTRTDLEQISRTRALRNQTTSTTEIDFDAICRLLAERLGVGCAALLRAAERSVHPRHCPSSRLIVLWLSKPLVVEMAMVKHAKVSRFAWVDAAFNACAPRDISV